MWISGLLVLGAYLLGAVPFGLLVARQLSGVDVRESGSRNIGATNVARTAGKGAGLLTLFLDASKGAGPVLVATHVFHQSIDVITMVGFAAVLGHIFPIYLSFKGGKGVATAAGVFLAVTPIPTLIAVGVFAVVFAIGRIVSIGSLVATIALVAACVIYDGRPEVIALAALVTLLVLIRHKGNIQRLLKRTEKGI